MQRLRYTQRMCETLESRQALAVSDSLVISELMYHPSISAAETAAGFNQDDFEFLELENTGNVPLELNGLKLGGGITFDFGPFSLPAKSAAVVVQNRTAFTQRYGANVSVIGKYNGTLSNNNEVLRLTDALGAVLFDFEYRDSWYPITDGEGYSLQVADTAAPHENWGKAIGWKISDQSGGSPGIVNSLEQGVNNVPGNVQAVQLSSRHIELSWSAPPAPDAPVDFYRIYRDGEPFATTKETKYLDATVKPGKTWKYQIAAVNTHGVESLNTNVLTIKIEPVGGELGFGPGEAIAQLNTGGSSELSGMAASRRNPGILWMNDDGVSTNKVLAISTEGVYLSDVILLNVLSVDWEDIAVGPGPTPGIGYVYVGDIGDNLLTRTSVHIFRFAEPLIDSGNPNHTIELQDDQYASLELVYPDGPHDAEVLMIDPILGDLYIVTKANSDSGVYFASAAQLAQGGGPITLAKVATVSLNQPSGGDFSPDGSEIILRNEDTARIYLRTNNTAALAFTKDYKSAPVIGRPVEPNGEAIAYATYNTGYYTVSEGAGATLYFFPRLGPWQAGDANRDGRFNTSDLVQIFQAGRYDSGTPALWSEGDWNGDGFFDTADLVAAFQLGLYAE